MVYINFPRQIIQPIMGMALLGVCAIAPQSLLRAQLLPSEAETLTVRLYAQNVQPEFAHKLGGGDRILVEILEVPELSGEYEVVSDGSVTLRLVGNISVKGMTLLQATEAITAQYNPVLKDPVVSVILVGIRPLNVGVTGEVSRPGNYTINLISGVGIRPGVQYQTVTQAIEKAGGITQAADLRRVQVRRSQRFGPDRVIIVNLWEVFQAGDFSQDIIVQDGDTIFVPTTASINIAEAREISSASFSTPSDQPRTVTVVGEVTRPGTYVAIGGNTGSEKTLGLPTVTRALQLAGGITSLADIRQIQLRRPTREGEQIISLNLWQLLETGDVNQDAIVQQGDTIVVPRAKAANPAEAAQLATASFFPNSINVYVVGEIRGTAEPLVKLPGNTSLNQALLARGSFGIENPRAKRRSIDLIRLNEDGTVSKRTINLDFTQGINEETNPLLRNNDIIVVDRSAGSRLSDEIGSALGPVQAISPVLRLLESLSGLFRIFR